MTKRATGTFYAGTSGWSYADWAGGRFYPRGLKPGDWLAYYAREFTTVEVNMTFYRLPKAELLERWRAVVPKNFVFAVKLSRPITHIKRLRDCDEELKTFFDTCRPLGRSRGPLLAQLPPSLRRDDALLEDFLKAVKHAGIRRSWKGLAIEFRNPEWICPEVYRLLNEHGAAAVLADMPRCPVTKPNDAPFVYVRRHGPGGRYRGRYSRRHIGEDARRIRDWLAAGQDVYVYFNNDVEGYAVDNARELIEAVNCETVCPPD